MKLVSYKYHTTIGSTTGRDTNLGRILNRDLNKQMKNFHE
jgi:hypothetical protein